MDDSKVLVGTAGSMELPFTEMGEGLGRVGLE